MAVDLQRIPLIGLAAALPVAVFLLARGELFVLAAFVNVGLIVAGLYYMLSPAEADHGHGHGPEPGA